MNNNKKKIIIIFIILILLTCVAIGGYLITKKDNPSKETDNIKEISPEKNEDKLPNEESNAESEIILNKKS